jgi:hypothetical protein
MENSPPWIGLAALLAMFVLPFLPSWLFEGPRRVKHWPAEHVCGRCDAPWTKGHTCPAAASGAAPSLPPPLRGELHRHPRQQVLVAVPNRDLDRWGSGASGRSPAPSARRPPGRRGASSPAAPLQPRHPGGFPLPVTSASRRRRQP